MDIGEYKTVGAWYKKMKADGYEIPLTLYHTLTKLIEDKKIPFKDAYRELESEGRIKVINRTINFDLNENK